MRNAEGHVVGQYLSEREARAVVGCGFLRNGCSTIHLGNEGVNQRFGATTRRISVYPRDASTLLPIIGQFVAEGSTIHTDELNSYNAIDSTKYTHRVVNHGKKEFVKGGDFTNTIEGFWSTLKRMIEGIYHFVSSKYLQRYVDEAVYRYNNRRKSGKECFRLMFAQSLNIVDYKQVKMI